MFVIVSCHLVIVSLSLLGGEVTVIEREKLKTLYFFI